MKLISAGFEILEQNWTLDDIYKQIEIGGRTAYKSHDKMTDESSKEFVERMIKLGHGAVLEHGTVYLDFTDDWQRGTERYTNNPYSKVYKNTLENGWESPHLYVTTNFRVLVENGWLNDLEYLCEPTKYHEKRISVRVICDQGVLREFSRHRTMSLTVESTRFCNYSSDKFSHEITYIFPLWIKSAEISTANVKWDEYEFIKSLKIAEKAYFDLLKMGWKPQQARNVLPLATKTEMFMTAFSSDWEHFFNLRTPESAHPQAREIAIPLKEEFINKKYI